MNNIKRELSEAINNIALEINKLHRIETLKTRIADNERYLRSLYKELNSTNSEQERSILNFIQVKQSMNLELIIELSQLKKSI